jgi:hypothetical protein
LAVTDRKDSLSQASSPVLYVNLVLHAEENYGKDLATGETITLSNRADYQNEAQFNFFSNVMRLLAQTFNNHGAKINFQADWTFIRGVEQWDPTFFYDLEAMGHEIDAHAHETMFTYPDVWLMIQEAGGTLLQLSGDSYKTAIGQFVSTVSTIHLRYFGAQAPWIT